jgi:hypothetical protein
MKKFQLSSMAVATALLLSGCGGAGKDPDPAAHPIPASTVAELSGAAVKGTLTAAKVGLTAFNGTSLTLDGSAVTDTKGVLTNLKLTSAPGYAFNGLYRVTVSTDANSKMVCDAVRCGDIGLGQSLGGAALGNLQLQSLVWIKATLGASADNKTDATFQANALSTFATALLAQAMTQGRAISAMESLAPAQLEYSSLLLRILGVEANNLNLFTEALLSTETAANLQTASNNTKLLSLLNAAFADFAPGDNLQASLTASMALVTSAAAGDFDAAVALREKVLAAWAQHPVITELGLDATKLIDLKLPLVAEMKAGGPVREYTTAERMATAVITARGAIGDGEAVSKAFDGDSKTKWLDNKGIPSVAAPSWAIVKFAEAVPVSTLSITSANDADSRDPESFNIEGSNDGTNWTPLASWAGVSFSERFQTQDFGFSNTLAYRQYRVNITKNKGNDSLMQLAEIELIGPVYADVDHSDAGGNITARGAISASESADKVFDNDGKTKWLDNKGIPTADAPSWVQIDLAEAKAVTTLALTSANDADSRDPENFNLQGSNDGGANWSPVATFAGESFAKRAERRTFSTGNSLVFSSYRLNISKNKGNDTLMQVAEVELIGPPIAAKDHSSAAIITARGAIGDAESPDKAFDDKTSTKWLDNKGVPSVEVPSWVMAKLPEAKAVNVLAITSANDADSRDPENFTLEGSMDGVYWVKLQSWAGVSFAGRLTRQQFPFSNDVGFSYYRLNISKNKGNDSLMQIAEIELIGPDYLAQDVSSLRGVTIKTRASISASESGAQVFDNNHLTKWLDNGGVPTVAAPAWVSVSLAQSQIVSAIAITSANDAPSRDIENFSLLGSNDGTTWVKITDVAGLNFAGRYERQVLSFGNGRAYQHYKVDISKNKGNDSLTQVAELELLGPTLE